MIIVKSNKSLLREEAKIYYISQKVWSVNNTLYIKNNVIKDYEMSSFNTSVFS